MNGRNTWGSTNWFPASCLPPHLNGMECVLVSRVLPMGFLNSVSIAQHIHRNVVRQALVGSGSLLGGEHEFRRDRAIPSAPSMYRVYLDNFDLIAKVDERTARLIKGEVSLDVLRLRQQYAHLGLPRHPKKAVQQQPAAEIQGAIVNGLSGRVTPKPQKVLKYFELVLRLVAEGSATLKQMQIACGGLVYCCMFRRPLLGMLNSVWTFMNSLVDEPPVVRKPLPPPVALEFLRFLGAMPLAQMNLIGLGFLRRLRPAMLRNLVEVFVSLKVWHPWGCMQPIAPSVAMCPKLMTTVRFWLWDSSTE